MLNPMHKYNGLRWHGSKIIFIHALKMFYIHTEHDKIEGAPFWNYFGL
jgi:hypothetical protein